MKNNIFAEELLWGFEQKAHATVKKTTANYKLVIQGMKAHFLPPKSLKHHKMYLHWGLFITNNPR